ncbi:MAG: DUF4388 domain-containing protein [bacterium]|nr:DUF4388 domain-containing protein [bacterium]
MGRLDRRGSLPLVESAHHHEWSGVIRLRNGRMVGAVWMVKGHLVHAVMLQDGAQIEGVSALESISAWREGTYFLDPNALPPARTIRLGMADVLSALRRSAEGERRESAPSARGLSEVLQALRERVPGLESLSLSRGITVEATTTADAAEREWVNGQIRRYCDEDESMPERLFVQDGDHALLIVKKGRLAAVLSARGATAPEALLWAGEEAQKEVLDRSDEVSVAGNS